MLGCGGGATSDDPVTINGMAAAGPAVSGWTVRLDDFDCRHVAVEARCENHWCRIPAGCFIMGSPEEEPDRGMYTERLTPVTLTRPFEIMQHEVTQAEWTPVMGVNPTGNVPVDWGIGCREASCPVGGLTWAEALDYANRLSLAHRPALPACYALSDCEGKLGEGRICKTVALTTPTPYECLGYRLPTEAEWEYAARAGTRTTYYTGDLTPDVDKFGKCDKLEDIAWYMHNSGNRSHPVGQKRPNRWGLFDMLGNAQEFTSSPQVNHDPPGPLVDPNLPGHGDSGVTRGGEMRDPPSWLRVAWMGGGGGQRHDGRGGAVGFRLVRTLPR